ncbi:MAG: hypothetical protein ACRDQB_02855 [Thermocrispum sp.]
MSGTTFGAPASAETLADRREFLSAGLRPVCCASCGISVLVKKNSPKHTSVQWTSPASDCPVLAARTNAARSTALVDTCDRLADTIRAAARDGAFEVSDG